MWFLFFRNYFVILKLVIGLFVDDLKIVFDDGSGRRKLFIFNKNNFFEGVFEGMLIYFGKKNIFGR